VNRAKQSSTEVSWLLACGVQHYCKQLDRICRSRLLWVINSMQAVARCEHGDRHRLHATCSNLLSHSLVVLFACRTTIRLLFLTYAVSPMQDIRMSASAIFMCHDMSPSTPAHYKSVCLPLQLLAGTCLTRTTWAA
jgi:hypothetical protein